MLTALIDLGKAAARAARWEEALAHYEEAFSLLASAGPASAGRAAEIARLVGNVHHRRGEMELAREAYDLALAIAEAAAAQNERAAVLICLGLSDQHEGDAAAAEARYRQARELAEELGDEPLLASVEHNLGVLANIQGDVQGALVRYRSSCERHRRSGNDLLAGRALRNIGMAHIHLEQWQEAARYLDEAFAVASAADDSETVGNVEIHRAELMLRSGRIQEATDHCDRALEIFGELELATGLGEVYKFRGMLYRESGRPLLAGAQLAAAMELARRSADRLLEAETLVQWALVHLGEERHRDALYCLNTSHHLFSQLHASRELHDLHRRLDSLEGSYLRVVRAWAESIESNDRYTAGHCERVANYGCMLAQAVGITGRDLTWMRMGGYLHDVGKISVPPEVLNKPGKLTAEEWDLIRAHTTEGDAIVSELNFPWDIRPIVRSHHERWNGTGYPDGLGGEEIPLVARVLCIADVYDALTTTRSYRRALSQEEALEIMEADVGHIFDPTLFPIFKEAIQMVTPATDERFPAFAEEAA